MKKDFFSKYTVISIISVTLFFVIWYVLTAKMMIVPAYVMPDPLKVFGALLRKFTVKTPDGATLGSHIAASLQVALMGFGFGTGLGVPLGILMAWYKTVDRIARPIFDFLRPIPPIAWIPVMILWLGIGTEARAAVIFMSAFIPNVINSYTGIQQTSQVHIWVGRTFGASDFELLTRVAIPSALPNIFTGMRLSLGTSWVSLVSAEMLASTRGLGYMIQIGRQFSRTDLVLAGMIAIGILGGLLAVILEKVENRIVKGRQGYGK
ncbi:MAG: ABC transporter permease [Spirochaetales bacterium]|jgi:NitT/TauT family transport system permease protein/taurine transport system permease protein|nr:ABC transporter permease [Spirochaetales bacterium]